MVKKKEVFVGIDFAQIVLGLQCVLTIPRSIFEDLPKKMQRGTFKTPFWVSQTDVITTTW